MRWLLLTFLILMTGMTSTAWAGLIATTGPALAKQEVVQGKAITIASTGTWNEEPTSYTYQWERCVFEAECSAISSTYTPVEGDVGYGIRVQVTAHKGESKGSASTGITIGVEPKYTSLYPAGN